MFANLCSYLALSTACIVLPAVAAEAKDNIPVNPKLLVKPPAEAIVLFDGKPAQMRETGMHAAARIRPAGRSTRQASPRRTIAISAAGRSSAIVTCTSSSTSR